MIEDHVLWRWWGFRACPIPIQVKLLLYQYLNWFSLENSYAQSIFTSLFKMLILLGTCGRCAVHIGQRSKLKFNFCEDYIFSLRSSVLINLHTTSRECIQCPSTDVRWRTNLGCSQLVAQWAQTSPIRCPWVERVPVTLSQILDQRSRLYNISTFTVDSWRYCFLCWSPLTTASPYRVSVRTVVVIPSLLRFNLWSRIKQISLKVFPLGYMYFCPSRSTYSILFIQ